MQSVNQGYYSTTYSYDGADQLTGETSSGASAPPTLGFTYDHNGNRLTQSVNGGLYQSFTYNGHDVLTSGTAGNETPGYDRNGSETSVSISGGTYHDTYDDEDRLTSVLLPSGVTDTFIYNGLGLRVGKTDSTGTYNYLCDGTSAGSPVLADGAAVYTAGFSDHRGNASTFSHDDLLGSLRFLTTGQSVTMNLLPDAFGETVSQAGSLLTPFGWNGASGYQSDAGGLKLLGHRYYDTRIGRFISQDPAGAGRNWYAYADNNPVNSTDPSGLSTGLPGTLGAPNQRYNGSFGSDPFGLFGEQSNTGNSQMGTGQGTAQQTQGLATPGTNLIFISQGMMHPAPVIIDDWTVSVSYGISVGLLFGRASAGIGVAYDITTRKFEFFRIGGISGGFDVGASLGLGFTVGNDTLGNFGGFNGFTKNIDLLGSSHGLIGYEWNPSYRGLEFSPPGVGPFEYTNFGFEYGLSYGKSNTIPLGNPFTIKLPTVTTLQF